uniref:Bifunctional inhibitor/plant lipid transfer protein/seed storage helical domain-containing protein n=1 Tax=Aegilops tauschii TaxID=37682 RepID=N1QVS7_AEGTA
MSMRSLLVLALVVAAAACLAAPRGAHGAGECGKTPADKMALKLAPPKCLCAVMLSDTAKSAGIKPEVAMSIPKRCNLVDRPVGYKCGAYTLP